MSKKSRRSRLKVRGNITADSATTGRPYPLMSSSVTKEIAPSRIDKGQSYDKYQHLSSDLKRIAIIAGALILILFILFMLLGL
jgi:hypothetical protein